MLLEPKWTGGASAVGGLGQLFQQARELGEYGLGVLAELVKGGRDQR